MIFSSMFMFDRFEISSKPSMIFMKLHLILNSFEVPCDKNPLFKIQSVLCGRLAINRSAGQFGLPQSAGM